MALNNYKNNAKEEKGEEVLPKPCTSCYTLTKQEDLVKYGSVCEPCFQSYCRQAPAYIMNKKYDGDPRGWAKRILDKHNEGQMVSKAVLEMAQGAVK